MDLVGHQKKKLKNHLKSKRKNKKNNEKTSKNLNLKSIKQASKDSVRAIMLIRAYRIRGHLIANLDPLSIQKKRTSRIKTRKLWFYKK